MSDRTTHPQDCGHGHVIDSSDRRYVLTKHGETLVTETVLRKLHRGEVVPEQRRMSDEELRAGVAAMSDRTTHTTADRLSAASEKLLADFDRTPDAIDHDELAARLWLIEQEVRAALRALPSEQAAGGDGLRAARDRMVDEVREGTRTMADAHWPDVATADRMRKAIDRIHLAVAAFANEMDAPASPPERVAE